MALQHYPESEGLKATDNPYLIGYLEHKEKYPDDFERLFDPALADERRIEIYNSIDDSIAEVRGSRVIIIICLIARP